MVADDGDLLLRPDLNAGTLPEAAGKFVGVQGGDAGLLTPGVSVLNFFLHYRHNDK